MKEVEKDEWMTIPMTLRGALHISSHIISCPGRVAHLVRAPSWHAKVVGSIAWKGHIQETNESIKQIIDVSISLSQKKGNNNKKILCNCIPF